MNSTLCILLTGMIDHVMGACCHAASHWHALSLHGMRWRHIILRAGLTMVKIVY
jgi:hypothetical protein